jgi:hypothetical protein
LKELNKTRGQVGLHKIKATREIKGIFSQGEVPSYTVT